MQKHIQYAHYSVIKIKNTFKYKIGRNFLNVVVFLFILIPDHRPHNQHTKIMKHITAKRHRKYKWINTSIKGSRETMENTNCASFLKTFALGS